MEHYWDSTDSQGYEMQCQNCGIVIGINSAEEWDENVDGECKG